MSYKDGQRVVSSETDVKVSLVCVSCGAYYIVIHDNKETIEYCPFCGSDIIEPEEDDFEDNWLEEYDE